MEKEVRQNATGDLDNPYFGGWHIYRLTNPSTSSTYSPDPNEVSSEFIWNGFLQDSFSVELAGEETSWIDNRKPPLELCIIRNYVIDRTGEPNYWWKSHIE